MNRWGQARVSDRVGEGLAYRVSVPFRTKTDASSSSRWEYYYAGAHARLFTGRALRSLSDELGTRTRAPACKVDS